MQVKYTYIVKYNDEWATAYQTVNERYFIVTFNGHKEIESKEFLKLRTS